MSNPKPPDESTAKQQRYTCSGCANTWTGLNYAHCPTCHRTFAGVAWFDEHRRASRCLDPANIMVIKTGEPRLRIDDNGIWRNHRRDTRTYS